MPALITAWLDEVGATHGTKQQANDRWVMGAISDGVCRVPGARSDAAGLHGLPEALPQQAAHPQRDARRPAGADALRRDEEKGYRDARHQPGATASRP
jgi:hypothetical protein